MILRAAMRAAAQRFSQAGLATPALDARVLAGAATGLDGGGVILGAEEELDAASAARLSAMVARRLAGEPVARIVGRREFWGLDFAVDAATLVPRPDSETVVEAALAAVDAGPGRAAGLRIADLGTGSGCLLVALLAELPAASGVGVDVSPAALAAARSNARRNGVESRAAFVAGSWMRPLSGAFDLIVCNPPYIATREIGTLAREVASFEPRRALDGGADGLSAYRDLLPGAAGRLAPGGVLVLEVGIGQADDVAGLATAAGLAASGVRRDLGGVARALITRRPCRNAPQKPLGKATRTG